MSHKVVGNIEITQKFDGMEIGPVRLIGEPTPVPGTNTMRCLANVDGMLALVQLSITFAEEVPDDRLHRD